MIARRRPPGRAAAISLVVAAALVSACSGDAADTAQVSAARLFGAAFVGTNGGFVDTKVLPATGVYTIVVDPQAAATGGLRSRSLRRGIARQADLSIAVTLVK